LSSKKASWNTGTEACTADSARCTASRRDSLEASALRTSRSTDASRRARSSFWRSRTTKKICGARSGATEIDSRSEPPRAH